METMTLEGLLQKVEKSERVTGIIDTLRDAIRERDELRKVERTARCEMIPDVVRWHERAEKAESELAALRKRIADSHAQLVSVLCDADGRPCIDGSDEDRAIIDGALRLLVEDDDV